MVFSSPDLATLHADLSLKNQQIALMKETLKERDIRILQLEHQLAGMKRSRFGATSEASNQYPLLFEHNTQEDHATGNASPKEKVSTHAKKETPKRKALPPHLARIDEPIELASPNCTVCGGDLHIIEHKVTEELDYIPARFVVRRIIRPRAVCRDCETMWYSLLYHHALSNVVVLQRHCCRISLSLNMQITYPSTDKAP